LTPDQGDSFAEGTAVAPTGRTSLTLVQNLPLDLNIVVDNSASMQQSTGLPNLDTPNPTDTLSKLDLVNQGITNLIESLPIEAIVSVISFDTFATTVTEKPLNATLTGLIDPATAPSRADVLAYVDSLLGNGTQTNYYRALDELLRLDNADYLIAPYDSEVLFLSDGAPTDQSYVSLLNALAFRDFDTTFVSLPGNSSFGNSVLSTAALRSQGQFIDYSRDAAGLQAAFDDPKRAFFGITGLTITNPDGTSYDAATDAFGFFTLDPYDLRLGDNTFTARASFADGTSFTDTLTLVGTRAGAMAPMPLPASVWMMLAAFAGLAGLRARRRA
jgi:hypothetical protein